MVTSAGDVLASRVFTSIDQQLFAGLSGDRNPMHMDAIAARRTAAGAPAVHGIHLLLWTLDFLAGQFPQFHALQSVAGAFQKFVTINDVAKIHLSRLDSDGFAAEVRVDGFLCTSMTGRFGEVADRSVPHDIATPVIYAEPVALDLTDMADRSETLAFATVPSTAETLFPHLANIWGGRRILALATASTVVGMACPGLHSIFSKIAIDTVADESQDGLHYAVTKFDQRFRRIEMNIYGGGIFGSAVALARMPPTPQPSMADIQPHITSGEFESQKALVVGGSRGLGETTAKCLATGGAAVTITYAMGQADAKRVRDEIRAAGGKCEVMAYDAATPAMLASLTTSVTHCYYFATSRIGRPKRGLFDASRLTEFLGIYVEGFYVLANALAARAEQGLTLFYPSSVYVDEHPLEMTEYAMAKAAGEVLCADLIRQNRKLRIVVNRLPRLPTDQTASLLPVHLPSVLDTMLPILRQIQMNG